MRMPGGLFIAGFFMIGFVVDLRLLKQAALALVSAAGPVVYFLMSLGADVHNVIEESNSTLS